MAVTTQSSLLDPADLARLQNLSLVARITVEGFLSGLHRAISHGHGTEFFQYRAYSPGEDLRHLDWKAYARSNELVTRLYREETELTLYLIVDATASMGYQGSRAAITKLQYAAMAAASFAYLADRQGDRVGLLVFGGGLRKIRPPRQRGSSLGDLYGILETIQPEGEGGIDEAVAYLEQTARGRSLVVCLTDLMEGEVREVESLSRLVHRQSDASILTILDPDERSLPRDPTARMIALEGSQAVLTSPHRIGPRFDRRVRERLQARQEYLSQHQIDQLSLVTEQPFHQALATFLDWRRFGR